MSRVASNWEALRLSVTQRLQQAASEAHFCSRATVREVDASTSFRVCPVKSPSDRDLKLSLPNLDLKSAPISLLLLADPQGKCAES